MSSFSLLSELLVRFEREEAGAEQKYSADDKLEELALEGVPTAAATSVRGKVE